MRIKALALLLSCATLIIGIFRPAIQAATTINYGNVSLSSNGTTQSGHFDDKWNLAAGDITITLTYDANGLVDSLGGSAHAWAELGIRAVGYGDFNPTFGAEGAGVWLATDYDWTLNTFAPDPVGFPNLDLDDKLLLQKAGGHGEGDYNLPSVPPAPGSNHRFWFDRDGVDASQAASPLAVNGGTYNTGGIYHVVIRLHATSATSGTAYITINGLNQGFETDANWNTMELTPAGMTFSFPSGACMQVFYGLYGYSATHSMAFKDIIVTGVLCIAPVGGEWVPINTIQMLVPLVGSALALSAIVASFVGFRRIKKRQN